MKEPYNYALKLLAKNDYSTTKLESKLANKYPDINSEQVIEKLKEKKLINDIDYAYRKAEKLVQKKYSDKYIISKLESEKLEISGEDLQIIRDSFKLSEQVQIESIIENKLILFKYTNKNTEQIKQKLSSTLASRGYSFEDTEQYLENLNELR